MKISAVAQGYQFEQADNFEGAEMIYIMPLYVEAARALLDLNAKWQKIVSEDPVTKYGDTAYVGGIIIEMDGSPIGTVMLVDDVPQFVPLLQKDKVEE